MQAPTFIGPSAIAVTSPAVLVNRQKLLEAAMRVFAEAGFRGATTRRIAEEAGVNEVTLFRQFKSKTALINEVAELYARRRSEEALPEGPVSPLPELSEWCAAHLNLLRNSREMIRKCMAEVHQHPQMAGCMRRGPDVVHHQLRDYTTKLVRQRGLDVSDEDIHVACMMLRGALFADAMGRDIMPDLYPPVRRAAASYARLFLRMLGANAEEPTPATRHEGIRNVERPSGSGNRRTSAGRKARPPRGT
jgi:AcrR family transcriptional regulator